MADDDTRAPSIIREGGYQGSRDPGRPVGLMQQQTVPVNHGSNGTQAPNSAESSND